MNEMREIAVIFLSAAQSMGMPAPTGDDNHLFLFAGLLVVAVIGIIMSIRILTKNRKKPR